MISKLEHYKEILSVLPRNNIKNNRKYLTAANQIRNEAISYKNNLVSELTRRFDKLNAISKNESIEKLKSNLNNINSNLYLLNKFNSSYEKSKLNNVLYDLGNYYKDDLEKVNQEILIIIDKFKSVGVDLKKEDFDYSNYVSNYMDVFFREINDLKSSSLKDSFDELYWKCPDIIHYIKINFRHLYFKNIKFFDKYYNNRVKDLNIKDFNKYYDDYKGICKELLEIENRDIKLIEENFINGVYDVKEFSIEKIDKMMNGLFSSKIETEEQKKDAYNSLLKLSNTLYEYKKYLKFKYIVESIKIIYQDKGNKLLAKATKKNIDKKEKIIAKMNKKIRFKKMFGKKDSDLQKFYSIINNNLNELKNLYNEYDENIFKEKVLFYLNDNSSILELLRLVYSYEINLLSIIKNNYDDISNEDIVKELEELEKLINFPNINIVNNLSILDERDLSLVIIDKYKLMDINITTDMLEEGNLDNLISIVDKLLINYYINDSKIISINDLSFMCEAKKIIDKNSNN